MSLVLAIDPGPIESAYAFIHDDCRVIEVGKCENRGCLNRTLIESTSATTAAIEMVASYGMTVGADVFETCVWIGRFAEAFRNYHHGKEPLLVYRRDVKLHHCGNPRAKDSNITQALIDRFAPGVPNRGKGTKKEPGFFYGFKADVWQAFALAVYVADTVTPRQGAA